MVLRALLYIFSFQKAAVGGDLLLKPGLYVKKGVVFLVLAFSVTPDLHQLGLQGAQHFLDDCQLAGITSLEVLQGSLQRLFLSIRDKRGCFLLVDLKQTVQLLYFFFGRIFAASEHHLFHFFLSRKPQPASHLSSAIFRIFALFFV